MDRAPRAMALALVATFVMASVVVAGFRAGPATRPLLAGVSWPPSTLLLSEVMTGGASASDEFVEVVNAGPAAVDLVGLEIAYITASGSTVTRKGTWVASLPLEPGRRVLLANAAGAFATIADATWTGGLAATGGALVLRPIGGAPIDAVGWGAATTAFVEGAVMVAAAPGSSIERRPGGAAGNGADTNDNATDWFVQAVPTPQNLAAPPAPDPASEPTPTPTATASAEPTPVPTLTPTVTPTATPAATPTPTATPTPIPSPAPDPSAAAVPIADARLAPHGAEVTIAGTLTTALGAIESGHGAFVEDSTGGIAIYVATAVTEGPPAGATIVATGVVDDRFAQRTLRVDVGAIVTVGSAALPEGVAVATGDVAETLEGRRVRVTGTTVGAPTAMADGTGLLLDDGTGSLRVVVAPSALGAVAIPSATRVVALGPVGQRDSSGTGSTGYRVHVTNSGDFAVLAPEATPTPEPTAASTPAPTATPTATPHATATPAPTPTPQPTPIAIADARRANLGDVVHVAGVVTADPGRLGSAALIPVQDATGAIVVHLPSGTMVPARGRRIDVSGTLAAPYGQLEVRPTVAGIRVGEMSSLPAPLEIRGADLGEAVEGRLVTIAGTADAKPHKSESGDLSFTITAEDGRTVRVLADATSELTTKAIARGATYRLTGIAGQRATGKGRLDGYRLWLRGAADIVATTGQATSSPGASTTPKPPGPVARTIAGALLVREADVTIDAIVTTDATLLDSTGRRIVVQDATAAIEVLVPAGATPPAVGTRVEVTGRVVRAYGAPRLRAAELEVRDGGRAQQPAELRRAPGPAHEWRLVRASGTLVDVHRLGSRWRAELVLAGTRVPIAGLTGAGIPASMLVEGRRATIVGIVRRPYPSATDRRFAIVPRSRADVAIGPAEPATSGRGTKRPGAGAGASSAGPLDVDLARLGGYVGKDVRVGGLVVELVQDGVTLDDGTAVGRVVLLDEAAEYLPLLEPEDAINATGRVEKRGTELVVVVRDPARLARVGDVPEPAIATPARPSPIATAPGAAGPRAATADPFGLGLPGTATVATLALVLAASLGVTLLRSRLARNRLLARATARVAQLAARTSPRSSRSSGPGSGNPAHG
ncbi:MAG TPA: lamin tail domain-containing protein [Candidatus Limnocylindrales bacterium]